MYVPRTFEGVRNIKQEINLFMNLDSVDDIFDI